MSKRILVTGVNGFVGQHLARELHEHGHEVIGTGQDSEPSANIADVLDSYTSCDLTDANSVANLPIDAIDAVINLAGIASVGDSFGKDQLYNDVNIGTQVVLAQRIQEMRIPARIISVSTGAVYDNTQPMPITEEGKLTESGSPYVRSKILMERALAELTTDDLDLVIVRPFNHTGPGQTGPFLLPDLANQLLSPEGLQLSPLNTARDFTDVRDVVRAYRLLATHPHRLKHRIYNVCSGKPVYRDQMVAELLEWLGHNDVPIQTDESLRRPHDPEIIFGDNTQLTSEIEWTPEISLKQTVSDFMNWRTAA